MPLVAALPPSALYRPTDPRSLGFDTTDDLPIAGDPLGQARALGAARFGLAMEGDGYNIFALGPQGTGKRHVLEALVREAAARRPVPHDLCYVHDFDEPRRPRALHLPPGNALRLRADMVRLVEEVAAGVPAALESDAFQTRLHAIEEEISRRSSARLEAIRRRAEEKRIAVLSTPVGMAFAPLRDGEVIGAEAFARLEPEERQRVRDEIDELQRDLESLTRDVPRWQRERRARVQELHAEISEAAVGDVIDELLTTYAALPEVCAYLEAARRDLVQHARTIVRLREHQDADPLIGAGPRGQADASFWRRYRVNVLVDRSSEAGAPVVIEDHPSYLNLLGRLEHVTQLGAVVTDFTLLRPGSLHRANGGYLIVDALKLLQLPFAWDGLKRALRSRSLRIEDVAHAYGVPTSTLDPEAVPLDVKVVLFGDRRLYYLLCEADPDMADLFKVAADFDDVVDRSPDGEAALARLVAAIAPAHGLKAFDSPAVARIIEDAARRAGDATRLSAHTAPLTDLLREADHWADEAGRTTVGVREVERALAERTRRADRIPALLREEVLRRLVFVDTVGSRVGQANALSVIQIASHRFGRPNRITARVYLGRGDVIDIEREVALGGPLHSKGVLILAAFVAARFATEQPLSLSVSLVFEQSYAGIDGDSASSAELYALLSAIAETPIRQGLACTGSVNQFGEVQPVGAIDEKVEGFFDLCAARGLTGRQGVLIPAANAPHLMLRRDVVDAVAEGAFHVYPVATVDEGAELLTGTVFGTCDERGAYPPGTLGARIQARLPRFARAWDAVSSRRGNGADR